MISIAEKVTGSNPEPNYPEQPPDDAPMVEWAVYYGKLGLKVVPLHSPLFDDADNCIGCTCEDYRRSERNRQQLVEKRREWEFNPNFKCADPGKHPRYSKWQERATSDENDIYWLWHWDINAGIGHNPGRAEFGPEQRPLIVVDADKYKDTFAGANLSLPLDTPTVLTGNLGEHDYFYMPPDKVFGQHTGDLPDGIDIRGLNNLAILPPTLHYSGRFYQWEADLSICDVEPQELPQHVIEQIEARKGHTRKGHTRKGRKDAGVGPSDIEAVRRSSELVEKVLRHVYSIR